MINIIPCDAGQIDILTDIAIKTYRQNYAYLWHDGGEAYIARVYDKPVLDADLAKPGVHYFFVYDDDLLIGYMRLKQKPHPDHPHQSGVEISKLYLLKQATGKGAGKKVMLFIFDWARHHYCTTIWLMVMEISPAKAFYESFGFIQTDRTRLDYPNLVDEYRWILTMISTDCV